MPWIRVIVVIKISVYVQVINILTPPAIIPVVITISGLYDTVAERSVVIIIIEIRVAVIQMGIMFT